MNKYQEALNCIKQTQVNFTDFGAFDLLQDFLPSDWIDTLQELIDNYNAYCKKHNKQVSKKEKHAYKMMKESGYFDE